MVRHLAAHGAQRVLGSAGQMGTDVVVKHDDVPREHDGTLSLDGGTNVSEGSAVALYVGRDVRVLESQL